MGVFRDISKVMDASSTKNASDVRYGHNQLTKLIQRCAHDQAGVNYDISFPPQICHFKFSLEKEEHGCYPVNGKRLCLTCRQKQWATHKRIALASLSSNKPKWWETKLAHATYVWIKCFQRVVCLVARLCCSFVEGGCGNHTNQYFAFILIISQHSNWMTM